jgi:diguanylate cyclase (GGDEF)-like protein
LTSSVWAALVAGLLVGLILARVWAALAARGARTPPDRAPHPGPPLVDVADVMRQLLAASGRRTMVPVILKLVRERLAPAQASVFVNRPDGQLALADGIGLPETLTRGYEVRPGEGRIGGAAVAGPALTGTTPAPSDDDPAARAGLRVEVAAAIRSGPRLHGVLAVAGSARPLAEQAAVVQMLAELSALAIVQVEKLKAIQETANIDGLTGVFNKRHFQERITAEIRRAEKEGGGVSLLLLDIDDFKNYNDRNGHLEGDEVLKRVGELLKRSIRDDDMAARYGGEEFVVVYPGAPKAMALRLAEALRKAVEEFQFPHGGGQPLGKVTISGGVAAFPEDSRDSIDLIRCADQALYEAKAAGRNRVLPARPTYLS